MSVWCWEGLGMVGKYWRWRCLVVGWLGAALVVAENRRESFGKKPEVGPFGRAYSEGIAATVTTQTGLHDAR
jgi:hypothetical protein